VRDTVGVSMSAGVAVYPLTSRTLEGAVREADAALGRAKQGGKARAVTADTTAA
jgi:predicted signal transduction protein with EAL and GGDEF domain